MTPKTSAPQNAIAISSAAPTVTLRGATLAYGRAALFENLDLELPGGRWTCLLGPSGVGKSSLLRLIAGLQDGHSGHIEADDGTPLVDRIAYMAQDDLLLPWLSVIDNVLLGARLRGQPADHQRARQLLVETGLDTVRSALPATLSGGMRQRAALARTLMEDRPLVLMDEPFSALDALTRLRMGDLAARLLAGRTVLLVTHDPLEALRLGHRVHVLAGYPATLDRALAPPGAPPRRVDDGALLALQGELLRRLDQSFTTAQTTP